jgi:hypothetical protein
VHFGSSSGKFVAEGAESLGSAVEFYMRTGAAPKVAHNFTMRGFDVRSPRDRETLDIRPVFTGSPAAIPAAIVLKNLRGGRVAVQDGRVWYPLSETFAVVDPNAKITVVDSQVITVVLSDDRRFDCANPIRGIQHSDDHLCVVQAGTHVIAVNCWSDMDGYEVGRKPTDTSPGTMALVPGGNRRQAFPRDVSNKWVDQRGALVRMAGAGMDSNQANHNPVAKNVWYPLLGTGMDCRPNSEAEAHRVTPNGREFLARLLLAPGEEDDEPDWSDLQWMPEGPHGYMPTLDEPLPPLKPYVADEPRADLRAEWLDELDEHAYADPLTGEVTRYPGMGLIELKAPGQDARHDQVRTFVESRMGTKAPHGTRIQIPINWLAQSDWRNTVAGKQQYLDAYSDHFGPNAEVQYDWLWHGTLAPSTYAMAHAGVDPKFCRNQASRGGAGANMNVWGEGTYFSRQGYKTSQWQPHWRPAPEGGRTGALFCMASVSGLEHNGHDGATDEKVNEAPAAILTNPDLQQVRVVSVTPKKHAADGTPCRQGAVVTLRIDAGPCRGAERTVRLEDCNDTFWNNPVGQLSGWRSGQTLQHGSLECPNVTSASWRAVSHAPDGGGECMQTYLMGEKSTGGRLAFRNLNCDGAVRACHTYYGRGDLVVSYDTKNPLLVAMVTYPEGY